MLVNSHSHTIWTKTFRQITRKCKLHVTIGEEDQVKRRRNEIQKPLSLRDIFDIKHGCMSVKMNALARMITAKFKLTK